MWVGAAQFDFRLRARSLKEKRQALRGIVTLLHQKFDCAVAEVDYQDLHQRAAVGVAIVAAHRFHAERVLREMERQVQVLPAAELIGSVIDVLRPGD